MVRTDSSPSACFGLGLVMWDQPSGLGFGGLRGLGGLGGLRLRARCWFCGLRDFGGA